MTTQGFLLAVATVAAIFSTNVTFSYNPLLTYTLRFKKFVMYANISGDYIINQYKEKQFVNANITINTNESINNIVAVFNRCNSEGYDCEYFQTWKFIDLCYKVKEKNQMWSPWYSAFDPPMTCPINKVHYQIKNGTFDVEKGIQWYPDLTNYHWRVTQKFYAGNTFVGSYMMDASIFGYRKKTKSVLSKILPQIP